MSDILCELKKRRLFFDGATGTVLEKWGLLSGASPDECSLTHPDKLTELHRAYLDAGCDIIKTDTFGVNSLKYENYREYIAAALRCARDAVSACKKGFVALDIGPTGHLLKPLGDLSFEDAVRTFSDTVRAAVECGGADLILIETMSDCAETKAALLAAKECSSLPVFVTNVYDAGGKLMIGADPAAMIAMLESMGADAVGMNCSLGPDAMLNMIGEFLENASVPVIVNPNAGLPYTDGGRTLYKTDAKEFSDIMVKMASMGVSVLGGCCGTDPEYIRLTAEKTKDIPYVYPSPKNTTVVSSYTHAVRIGDAPVLIGERINPTGKARLKEALRNGDMGYILNEAISQADAGVQILDVNVGLPEIDETAVMHRAVTEIQAVTDTVLQLDSSDPAVLEKAMRAYIGKPLINSVNGKAESMDAVFPLVKKYGGAVIALTLDENGIPDSAEGRAAIARKITERAARYGIGAKDIIVDPLALTVSSDQRSAAVTLEAVRLIHSAGLHTSLGVSNISFGLPSREKVNSTFFAAALEAGLDCAIMNPFDRRMTDVYYAYRLLHGLDPSCADYIAYAEANPSAVAVPAAQGQKKGEDGGEMSLCRSIVRGMSAEAAAFARELVKSTAALELINGEIIPALNEIGKAFEEKRAYLPQLLMSAEAASAAFDVLKSSIPPAESANERSFVIATVRGDIHDIGKNIVKVIMESYGFRVYDLGRDVPPEKVLECVRETSCRLVGLSALMTTTVPAMEETIRLLRENVPEVCTVVGGAVLNQDYADMIGADFYAADAMDTVRFAEKYYS